MSIDDVQRFRIHHRHEPAECRVVVAAWKGSTSPLRHVAATSSCDFGGHEQWWDVDGGSVEEVLALLPRFVAERSTATQIGWSVMDMAPAHETKEHQP